MLKFAVLLAVAAVGLAQQTVSTRSLVTNILLNVCAYSSFRSGSNVVELAGVSQTLGSTRGIKY